MTRSARCFSLGPFIAKTQYECLAYIREGGRHVTCPIAQSRSRILPAATFFHASATNGASLLCLTMSVTGSTIQARNVATQIIYDFDRRTGIADWYVSWEHYICTIDSVAPLPADIHEIMLSIDRKGREGEYREAEDPDGPWEYTLTDEERRGLLFISYFHPAFPL